MIWVSWTPMWMFWRTFYWQSNAYMTSKLSKYKILSTFKSRYKKPSNSWGNVRYCCVQMLVKNLCSAHPVGVDYESGTILEVPLSWCPKSWCENAQPFLQDSLMMCAPLEYSNALATEHLFNMSWSQLLLSSLCIWLDKKLNRFCASLTWTGPE